MVLFHKRVEASYYQRVASGEQIYDARLNRGLWKDIHAGDEINLSSGDRTVRIRIMLRRDIDTFAEAHLIYGNDLLPGVGSPEEAEDVYMKDFGNLHPGFYTYTDLDKFGAIVFKIKVVPLEDESLD